MRHVVLSLSFATLILVPFRVFSYPEFIGYGYSSCLTCHFNGHGNGPINDYGRALWSGEIASRLLTGNKTSEELAASSGFLFGAPEPWWLKPGIKARALRYWLNPGGQDTTRDILMQAEANAAILFDKKQRLIAVASFGHAPEPGRGTSDGKEADKWISREHYLRWQATKSIFVYLGSMDKVYGIRTVNHTAFSRAATGLAQNDQSHGLIVHYVKPSWEASVNLFLGNQFQDSELRQVGASGMVEFDVANLWRLGISALSSSNDFVKNERFGIHSKSGLGYGAALLTELGLIKDSPKKGTSEDLLGYYLSTEAIQKIFRGYHLFFAFQAYKPDMSGSVPDFLKLGSGLLVFPIARTEVRIEVENTRIYSAQPVQKDTWALLGQLHISL